MKTFLKTSLFSAVLLFAMADHAFGQSRSWKSEVANKTERIVILFPFDKSGIDRNFMNNAQSLDELYNIMSERAFISEHLDSIIITGSASPDGTPPYNKALAQRRANSVKNFILENYPDVKRSVCSIYTDQGYWDGLIGLVEQDPNVPARDEFLKMLKNPRLSDYEKARRMNTMQNGKILAYLRSNHLLRSLRQGSVLITFRMPVEKSQPESQQLPEYKPEPQPESELRTESKLEPQPEHESQPEFIPFAILTDVRYKTFLALRNNLLFNMIGGVNLGIEVPMGNHFSAGVDFAYAYTRINNTYAFQTLRGSVEARYWFKQSGNALTGLNLGIYGTYCSRFDVQFGRGFQGDGYWSCGLSGGYAIPLSNRFNIGFSIAGGFFHSPEIREYSKPQNGHLIWEKTRYNVNRITLTQVRVDLVWLINRKVK